MIPEKVNQVSLFLTDDVTVRSLNSEYRNKDQPTDVLSFSQLEGENKLLTSPLLGDIVISVQTAVRQARERDLEIEEELLRLIIHGLLHLAGYEHEGVTASVELEMQNEEDRLQALFVDDSRTWIRK